MKLSSFLTCLILSFLVTFAAAAIGATASVQAAEYYATLNKPTWAPPANVFGPVWTVLYVLMAIAAALVWAKDGFERAKPALGLYVVQLALNSLWSWIFFAWRQPGWAFLELLLLWFAIIGTTILFWRVRPISGWMMLPYLAWVTFAGALNAAVWLLNRST